MSLGGLDGFGSFNARAVIRRKGAGSSAANKHKYRAMEKELE